MRGFGLWILLLIFGTALLCVFLFSIPGGDVDQHMDELTKSIRKLKENVDDESGDGNIDMDDYVPDDPVPSSKAAALRPGPIEHGTPLMPYIPKPEPPGPNDP